MNPAPQFERVYAGIRAHLLSGKWPPGHRLDLASLADELGASITPVRDALYRLSGERLLAAGAHDGFAVPAVTEPALRDLYAWNRDLLLLAQDNAEKASCVVVDYHDGAIVEMITRLCHVIGANSNNPEHMTAIDRTSDRLHSARIAEVRLGIATEDELCSLVEAATKDNPLVLRNGIELYHLHRQSLAGRIVQALYRPETSR